MAAAPNSPTMRGIWERRGVLEYDAHGAKVRERGKRGKGPGQFVIAHAVAPDGAILAATRSADLVLLRLK